MQKTVINATQGGAHIKGTVRMHLKTAIEKHCREPIDKSGIKPLLTCADDGNELIEKVVPLLQNDIDILKEVIVNSRKGISVSHGVKTLMTRREYSTLLPKKTERLFKKLIQEAVQEARGNRLIVNQLFFKKAISKLRKSRLKTIMIMSDKNHTFSESAHMAAMKNPLVNVAIYGASRAIQGRDLKVESNVIHFLKNRKDALIRTERNIIILKAAKTAAESLKKSYEKTLELLKKYGETKDNSLLSPKIDEPIDLSDAEEYFESGNFAHPLLDATRTLRDLNYGFETLEYKQAKKIYEKALDMRRKAIKKAEREEEKSHDEMSNLLEHNELLKVTRRAGTEEGDFEKALRLMRKAVELMPDGQEARWGLATALHHTERMDESLAEYGKLVEDFPDNHTFRFEYGQVLLRNNELQEGLKQIGRVMEKTEEFDGFLSRLGEIYEQDGMLDEALSAYALYLKKYPHDYEAWNRKGDCLDKLGRKAAARKAHDRALKIKPID